MASTIVKIVAGLILLKIVSSTYGSSALPILGQALSVNALLIGVTGSGIGRSLIYLHKNSFDSLEKRQRLADASSFLLILLSLLILLATFTAAESISMLLANSAELVPYMRTIGLISLVISVSSLTMTYGAVEDRQERVALILIAAQILTITIVYVATKEYSNYHLYIFYAVIQAVVVAILMLFFARPVLQSNLTLNFPRLFDLRSFRVEIGEIVNYSSFITASVILTQVTIILVRSQVINNYGLTVAGAWEGALKVSEGLVQLTGVILAFVLLPEFVKQKNHTATVGKAIVLIVAFFAAAYSGIAYFGDYILTFLYTAEISGLTKQYLLILLCGDCLKVCFYVFQHHRLAKNQMRLFLALEVISAAAIVTTAIFATNSILLFLIGYMAVYFLATVTSIILYVMR